MLSKRPKRLKKEPIIDAIFEVRFSAKAPASNILPGVLYERLAGRKEIEKLSTAEIPEQIRASDPNLQFSPVIRVKWETFIILISDRSIAIGCELPYPGWSSFKGAINQVLDILRHADIVERVHRCSVKYVDMIERSSIDEQISAVNFDLSIGKNKIVRDNLQLRVETKNEKLIHVFKILTSAALEVKDGLKKSGIVVDIDTIMELDPVDMDTYLKSHGSNIDLMHDENINHFFDCLTEETLESLEPEYE